jgi:solute carrier family 35 (adenosine 3'-phospho 5'-phosphosulfate transporter), member B3
MTQPHLHHRHNHPHHSHNHQQTSTLIFRHASSFFDELSPNAQFAFLVGGVFFFFGLHNYLQEAIMHVRDDEPTQIAAGGAAAGTDGAAVEQHQLYQYSVMLGYFEVLGVAVGSYLERTYVQKEHDRLAPFSAYPLLTILLLSSSALSNLSLSYINFPTKVVFRSCKLIPTMLVAWCWHGQRFSTTQYGCAAAACLGLVCFAAADWETSPSFHPVGLLLVSLSVGADAILPNAQEKVFAMYGSSRYEVTLYTNIFTLAAMTISTYASGDLFGSLAQMVHNRPLLTYYAIYTIVAYIAISFHMAVVKRYGGVAAVLVATGRKAMTLIVSFALFPKGFTWLYPAGAALVLGGLAVASLAKLQQSNQPSPSSKHHPHKTTPPPPPPPRGGPVLPMTGSTNTEMEHLIDHHHHHHNGNGNGNGNQTLPRHHNNGVRRTLSDASKSPTANAVTAMS